MPTLKTIPFITRFAPSPTGFLHLGHAYSALMAFETAQASRGMMHLRIDDIDQARCRAKYEAGLIEDLKGLGVSWAEPVVRQSDRSALYRQALEQLETMGVVYECYKTRKDMAEAALSAPHGHEPHPMSPAKGPPALRLSLNAARNHLGPLYNALTFYEDGVGTYAVRPEINGDVILARKDIGIAYHLASVIDDAEMGITHIIRGQDLLQSTHTQCLLQALLRLPTPCYHHHQLVADASGQRLAKRKGGLSIRDYREKGLEVHDLKALIVSNLMPDSRPRPN